MLDAASVAWGYENRTVAVRIPGGSHKARRRVCRFADRLFHQDMLLGPDELLAQGIVK